MSDTAEINLFQKIPLILTVRRKDTGEILPQPILSAVVWHQDNEIGTIQPDQVNPNLATFTPSKAGVVRIRASALITLP